MGQALYREYRSKDLDDVLGQEHITKTLQAALKNGRIAHAYLFTGPRGVGKTSVARILAYEVNNLSYPNDEAQLDIIEIDAASNRRIDEIRDLRDRVHIAPTSSKYKVYIIDEVHMLTKEAFNALLKTLEEPPAHCIFILATTEGHKVPETIVSRTQKYVFKPVAKAVVVGRLSEIAKNEKLEITKDALELLAEHGNGSFRDSISMLDQLGSSGQKIDAQLVRLILGLPQESQINELLDAVASGSSSRVMEILDELASTAVDPSDLAKSLADKLRHDATNRNLDVWQIELLKNLVQVSGYGQGPQTRLEIALLGAASQNTADSPATLAPKSVDSASETQNSANEDLTVDSQPEPLAPKVPVTSPAQRPFDLVEWPAVLSEVKSQAASLYTALRLAEPSLSGSTLTLAFQFPLHQKKLDSARAKDTISQIIFQLTGEKISIVCVLQEKKINESTPIDGQSVSELAGLQSISNIFGGGEVLESEAIN